jgi:hypothetical protein
MLKEPRLTFNTVSRRQFLKTATVGILSTLVFSRTGLSSPSRESTLYIGTYTSGQSEGIYGYRMDAMSGA